MQEAIAYRLRIGAELALPFQMTALARALLNLGRTDEAITVVMDALERSAQTGERWWDAEIQRLMGDLVLCRDPQATGKAEEQYRIAIDRAGGLGAKSLELRSAMSLARLCGAEGRHEEGYEVLAPVYEWFTEGFDTPDLQEAKALLDELGCSSHGVQQFENRP